MFLGALSFSCSNDDGGKKDKPAPKPDYEPKILVPFQERGLWGFRDPQANVVVVVPQYEEVKDFDSHKIARVKKTKLWGLINMLGKTVIDPTYNNIEDFSGEGYATVVKLEKSGVINTKGEEKVEPIFDKVFGYYDKQYVKVQSENKFGIIDKDWKLVIKPTYTKIREFGIEGVNANHIVVEQNTKRGLLNKDWKTIAPAKYDSITKFDTRGVAFLIDSLRVGMLNPEGRILEPKYDQIKESLDEAEITYKVVLKEKWGLLNKDWKEIITPRFDADFKIFEFDKSGYARIHVGDKWGFIDKSHRVVLEPIYDEITEFDVQGFARIKVGDKWGVLNNEFKVLLEPIYDEITGFDEKGYARVSQNNKWGVINKEWKVVLPIEYNLIGALTSYKMTKLLKEGKIGLADENWKIVLPVKYADIKDDKEYEEDMKNYNVIHIYENDVHHGKLEGLFNVKNNDILEPVYKEIGKFDRNGNVIVTRIDIKKNLVDNTFKLKFTESYDNITLLSTEEGSLYEIGNSLYVGRADAKGIMLLVPDTYINIKKFDSDNKAVVTSKSGLIGLIDKQWKEVLAPEYVDISNLDTKMNRLLTVEKGILFNIYTQNGKKLESNYNNIIPDYKNGVILLRNGEEKGGLHGFATDNLSSFKEAKYKEMFNFSGTEVSAFSEGEFYGLMNKQGVKVIGATYDRIIRHKEDDHTTLVKGGLYGFANSIGLITVDARYEMPDYSLVTDGLAKVRYNGNITVVNYTTGVELFKPGSVSDTDNLFNGYASYQENGRWGIVNKSGAEIAKAKYDKVERFNREDNTVRMTLGSYKGVMNAKGIIIVEANKYEYIGVFKDGKAQATRAGASVTLDSNGKEI